MTKTESGIVMSQSEYDRLIKNVNWLAEIVIHGHDNSDGEADFEADANRARNIKKTLKLEEDAGEDLLSGAV